MLPSAFGCALSAVVAEFSGMRLEIMTEFVSCPEGTIKKRLLKQETDEQRRAAMSEPDWEDDELEFGEDGLIRMGQGKAFSLNAGEEVPTDEIEVAKRPWGRTLVCRFPGPLVPGRTCHGFSKQDYGYRFSSKRASTKDSICSWLSGPPSSVANPGISVPSLP